MKLAYALFLAFGLAVTFAMDTDNMQLPDGWFEGHRITFPVPALCDRFIGSFVGIKAIRAMGDGGGKGVKKKKKKGE